MKALVCSEFGRVENLEIKNLKLNDLGVDEVEIEIKACSLNFPDLLIMQNKYQFEPKLPFAVGGEFSGIITRVGEEVADFELGDRVFSINGWGGVSERAHVKADKVFRLQKEIDYVVGSSLFYNFSTAYYGLKNKARLKEKEIILILGASGALGLAAIELAKNMGAIVIAAASSQEKLAICKSKGADFLLNYSNENLRERIKDLTQSNGLDVVFDPIGGNFSEQALRELKWNGRFLVVGFATGEIPRISLNLALLKGISIIGVFWSRFATEQPFECQKNMKDIFNMFCKDEISVSVYDYYSFERSKQAFLDLRKREVIGKPIIILDDSIVNRNVKVLRRDKAEIKLRKRVFNNINEIFDFVGKDFPESQFVQITQEMVNEFAFLTGDKQWIHVDKKRAENSVFKSTIVHGFFTASLIPKFLKEIYEVKGSSMGINYGIDNLRFLIPIKTNSEVQLSAKLIDTENYSENAIKMIIKVIIKIKGIDKPALIATCKSLVYF